MSKAEINKKNNAFRAPAVAVHERQGGEFACGERRGSGAEHKGA